MAGIQGKNVKDNVTNPQRLLLVDGLIESIVSGDLGNADTSYTYIPWGSQGFTLGSLQMAFTATTLTIEMTNDPTSVADGDAVWVDVTEVMFGVANFIVDSELIIDDALIVARLRIKRVTTNATNAFACRLSRSN